MTWLAWRGQRAQLVAIVAAVAVFAGWLALSGTADQSAWLAVSHCGQHCSPLALNRLSSADYWTSPNRLVLTFLPGVIGLVLGAPIVAREIEAGTNRFAWTQTIGRTHWLVTKLLVAGIVAAGAVGALDPLLAWWTGAVRNGPRILPMVFSVTGFVDVGYALFAFMLGALLGSVIRRTGWAIVAGVPLFVAARAWVQFSLRAHLAPVATFAGGLPAGSMIVTPSSVSIAYAPEPSALMNDWQLNQGYVPVGLHGPAAGQTWSTGWNALNRCTGPFPNGNLQVLEQYQRRTQHCIASLKLHYVQQYQPPSHYWRIQAAETALFVGAALVLLGLTVFVVRRWRT
jgi:hypothetical protein